METGELAFSLLQLRMLRIRELTDLGSHNQYVVEPGPKPGSELLDSKTWALTSVLKGRVLPSSQSVGTVVLHGGYMPSCLQTWVKPFGSHSFKERSYFPEGKKKHGRKWDTWELEAFLKSPLVCAPLGPGLAGPGADSLPQVFIHSKKIFFSKYLKTMPWPDLPCPC